MTKTREPYVRRPVLQTDIALDHMTLEQLRATLATVEGQSVPALARATDAALRSAARSYLRTGRLKPEAVLAYLPKFG